MRVAVSTQLHCGALGYANLPPGKTWDDVDSWHIKWDNLYLTFKDGSTAEMPLDSDVGDGIDWKRPESVTIHPVNNGDDFDVDFDTELASRG